MLLSIKALNINKEEYYQNTKYLSRHTNNSTSAPSQGGGGRIMRPDERCGEDSH